MGMSQGDVIKVGLDSLDHNIRGDVYQYKSMIAYDDQTKDSSLLHLLWRLQGRVESYAMSCLEILADIIN